MSAVHPAICESGAPSRPPLHASIFLSLGLSDAAISNIGTTVKAAIRKARTIPTASLGLRVGATPALIGDKFTTLYLYREPIRGGSEAGVCCSSTEGVRTIFARSGPN